MSKNKRKNNKQGSNGLNNSNKNKNNKNNSNKTNTNNTQSNINPKVFQPESGINPNLTEPKPGFDPEEVAAQAAKKGQKRPRSKELDKRVQERAKSVFKARRTRIAKNTNHTAVLGAIGLGALAFYGAGQANSYIGKSIMGVDPDQNLLEPLAYKAAHEIAGPAVNGGWNVSNEGIGGVGIAAGIGAAIGISASRVVGGRKDFGAGLTTEMIDEALSGEGRLSKLKRFGAKAVATKASVAGSAAVIGAGAAVKIYEDYTSTLAQRMLEIGSSGITPTVRSAQTQRSLRYGTPSNSRISRNYGQTAMNGSTVLALHRTGGRGGVYTGKMTGFTE